MASRDDRRELGRLLNLVADDLEHRGYKATGVVRQAARALAGLATTDPDACEECGATVTQPERGRRRRFCSPRCRATKWRRNARVAS